MQSCHLLFGLLLLLLLPTTRFLILLPTYDSSLLIMWPNHLNLVSRNFCPSSTTPVLLLTSSFLILSFLVFPVENLNIFISATSILFSCVLVTPTVSIPYSNAGLTITLYNLPFNFYVTFLSHIAPVIFFHAPQPACTLFITSFSDHSSACSVDPRYLNCLTLFTSSPCTCIVIASSCSFQHKYAI